jgi:hypothetical protein
MYTSRCFENMIGIEECCIFVNIVRYWMKQTEFTTRTSNVSVRLHISSSGIAVDIETAMYPTNSFWRSWSYVFNSCCNDVI